MWIAVGFVTWLIFFGISFYYWGLGGYFLVRLILPVLLLFALFYLYENHKEITEQIFIAIVSLLALILMGWLIYETWGVGAIAK